MHTNFVWNSFYNLFTKYDRGEAPYFEVTSQQFDVVGVCRVMDASATATL